MNTTSWMVVVLAAVGATVLGGCSGNIDADAAGTHASPIQSDAPAKRATKNPGACMLAILCEAGTMPSDTNGDGCDDACLPVACPAIMIDCAPGSGPVDSNGDGCQDSCGPVACPAVMMLCEAGMEPADTNGDGCIDTCAAAP